MYQVRDDLALVTTADLITPLLDDPGLFGAIAAANALSDVYAMGGRPLTALNLCVFPRELTGEVARELLAGAQATVAQAGAVILGGHTVRGPELLYGLAVTGEVHPARVWRNVGAQAGDALLLTKPLGTGLFVTALRRGLVALPDHAPDHAAGAAGLAAAIAGMRSLNRAAAEILATCTIHACTDVTGFGLLGHALGMTRAGARVQLSLSALPVYPGALALAEQGVTCGGARANRQAYTASGLVTLAAPLDPAQDELLHDPQTSGGLLAALPQEQAAAALRRLHDAGVAAAQIGAVLSVAPDGPPEGRLIVVA